MKTRWPLIVCGLIWLLAATCGLRIILAYESTPGAMANPARQWPTGSHLQPAPGRATLVMLAHPHCPCTRASIGELNALMAQCPDKVQVYVLFFKPKGFADGWEQTDLWRSASAIPGVQAICDEGGVEAHRFHATTSGQTLLFNSAGQLLFSGGITGGRGHSGDNLGRDTVVSLLTTGKAEHKAEHKAELYKTAVSKVPVFKTPVFGCSLGAS